MSYKEELELILENMEKRRALCLKELKRLPKGTLYLEKDGKYQRFRRCYKRNGELVRESLGRNAELLKQMRRKAYYEKEVAVLNADCARIRSVLTAVMGNSFETIRSELKNDIGNLNFEDVFVSSESGLLIPRPSRDYDIPARELELNLGDIDRYEWAVMPYRENTSHLEDKRHVGATGLYYRSRAELHVFEHMITKRKQPVHYDETIEINGELFSPDGIAPSRRNEIVLIEYMEMNDTEYFRRNARKLEAYHKKGFTLGRNLLVISSETNGYINMLKLDKMLDAFLL